MTVGLTGGQYAGMRSGVAKEMEGHCPADNTDEYGWFCFDGESDHVQLETYEGWIIHAAPYIVASISSYLHDNCGFGIGLERHLVTRAIRAVEAVLADHRFAFTNNGDEECSCSDGDAVVHTLFEDGNQWRTHVAQLAVDAVVAVLNT